MDSNKLITAAVRKVVPRFTVSQGRRVRIAENTGFSRDSPDTPPTLSISRVSSSTMAPSRKSRGNDPGQPAVVHDRQLDPTFDLGRYRMTFQELLEGAQESGYIAVRKESQEISPG